MSNINSYVWKDKRLTHDREEKQVEYKMVDNPSGNFLSLCGFPADKGDEEDTQNIFRSGNA